MRKVTWTATVPRDMLPVDARNSLGAILTLFSVSDDAVTAIEQALSDEFPVVTERIEENDIADAGEDVIEKAREFVKDTLQNLNWNDMEQLVAGLLRAMGYRATVSPVGPDRGRGIIASPDGLGLEDPRIVVEVKHRKGTIGAPEVRAFVGGLRRAKGVYVSTGGFTREAQYEADRSETPLTLVDIDALARLVEQYYDQFDNDARAILPLRKVYWPL